MSPRSRWTASALLAEGEVPVEHVNSLLSRLPPDGYILLVTDFEPSPILDAVRKQRRRAYHKPADDGSGHHFTYIGL